MIDPVRRPVVLLAPGMGPPVWTSRRPSAAGRCQPPLVSSCKIVAQSHGRTGLFSFLFSYTIFLASALALTRSCIRWTNPGSSRCRFIAASNCSTRHQTIQRSTWERSMTHASLVLTSQPYAILPSTPPSILALIQSFSFSNSSVLRNHFHMSIFPSCPCFDSHLLSSLPKPLINPHWISLLASSAWSSSPGGSSLVGLFFDPGFFLAGARYRNSRRCSSSGVSGMGSGRTGVWRRRVSSRGAGRWDEIVCRCACVSVGGGGGRFG